MATMKKTTECGTLFANSYETNGIIGVNLGIYKQTSVACLEEENGKLRLLINEDAANKMGVTIIHCDNDWNPIADNSNH